MFVEDWEFEGENFNFNLIDLEILPIGKIEVYKEKSECLGKNGYHIMIESEVDSIDFSVGECILIDDDGNETILNTKELTENPTLYNECKDALLDYFFEELEEEMLNELESN